MHFHGLIKAESLDTIEYINPSCWTRICPVFANSLEPDHLASSEANWSGSSLFAIKYVNLYQQSGWFWPSLFTWGCFLTLSRFKIPPEAGSAHQSIAVGQSLSLSSRLQVSTTYMLKGTNNTKSSSLPKYALFFQFNLAEFVSKLSYPKLWASLSSYIGQLWVSAFLLSVSLLNLTLVLPNQDMPCLCKQCRSRSVSFFRSQMLWICPVCHLVCEFISAIWAQLFKANDVVS